MLRLVWRGMVERKVRVILTAVAVALGVALMAGTYILTDTINRSFAEIFQTANQGNAVVVTPQETLGRGFRDRSQSTPIDEAMVRTVAAVDGVSKASGVTFVSGSFLSTSGEKLTTGGAPAFISSVQPKPFNAYSPVKGGFPTRADQVAVDESTANRANLKLGEHIVVVGTAPAKQYTIVGVVHYAGGESFGGAGVALLTATEAQRVAGQVGHFNQIDVAATSGVTPKELRDRIKALLPSTVAVRTGAEQASNETQTLEENLGFLQTFLLIFAYVALLVGAFIIFNTFSITVAQRTREFGLLRTLGASRGQVMRSVILEGLFLGILGGLLGLLGGILLAPGLDGLFKAVGADLPNNGTVLETRTIVVSLAVGIGITLIAGLVPAIRSTSISPLAAMREGSGESEVRKRGWKVAAAIGVLALLEFLTSVQHGRVPGAIIGAVVALVAARWIWIARGHKPSYRITRGLAHIIGAPAARRGITGRLAMENSIRQPGRTLTTAAALTIGIALVAMVAVLADGTKATINQSVNSSFAGNLIIRNSSGARSAGLPPEIVPQLKSVDGVSSVTAIGSTEARPSFQSENASVLAVEPQSFVAAYHVDWHEGSNAVLRDLGETQTVVTHSFAKSHNLKTGSPITALTPTGEHVHLTVAGVAEDISHLLGELTISRALAVRSFGLRELSIAFVTYASGASGGEVKQRIDALLRQSYPQAQSQTASQFAEEQSEQVNTLLTLIYVLLALSVIVSLFGIVNTLVLSIYERTRELGMLRAIGTSRRQVRQMIRYESVITALIGGVFGIVIGVVGAFLVATFALEESEFVQSYPIGTLAILLVVAALAGILAAQLPARRAANLDMLNALASE